MTVLSLSTPVLHGVSMPKACHSKGGIGEGGSDGGTGGNSGGRGEKPINEPPISQNAYNGSATGSVELRETCGVKVQTLHLLLIRRYFVTQSRVGAHKNSKFSQLREVQMSSARAAIQ